jgi:hypothetical protein
VDYVFLGSIVPRAMRRSLGKCVPRNHSGMDDPSLHFSIFPSFVHRNTKFRDATSWYSELLTLNLRRILLLRCNYVALGVCSVVCYLAFAGVEGVGWGGGAV